MTVVIPESFARRIDGLGPKFCRVEKGGKNPNVGGKAWDLPENLMYSNDPKLLRWLSEGGNYGVCDIPVLELDSELAKQKAMTLPDTLTVQSPRGEHRYYLIKDSENLSFFDPNKSGSHIGSLRAESQMVVGPNCRRNDGGEYSLLQDLPIARISMEQIKEAFKGCFASRREMEHTGIVNAERKAIGDDLPITDVASLAGMRRSGDEYFGAHPVHGSENGQNFWINPSKNVWHCFRHGTGGGPLLWLAVKERMIDCSDAIAGALRGEKFKQVLERAVALKLIELPKVKVVEQEADEIRDKDVEKLWPTPKLVEYGSTEQLLGEIRAFLKKHLKITPERDYDLLALTVLESYRVNDFPAIGYPRFLGLPGSGKTRALETMGQLVYRPRMALEVTEAFLYHEIQDYQPTLLIDEIGDSHHARQMIAALEPILNAGYKNNGSVVPRRNADNTKTQYFRVYGLKIIAGTGLLRPTTEQRCINFFMYEDLPDEYVFDEEEVAALRGKLEHYHQNPPPLWAQEKNGITNAMRILAKGFRNSRVAEKYLALLQLAPTDDDRLSVLSKAFDDARARHDEDEADFNCNMVQAILECQKNGKVVNEALKISDIVEQYNKDLSEDEQIKPISLGRQLTALGFSRKRLHGGTRAITIRQEHLDRLNRRWSTTAESSPEGLLGQLVTKVTSMTILQEGGQAQPKPLGEPSLPLEPIVINVTSVTQKHDHEPPNWASKLTTHAWQEEHDKRRSTTD